MKCIENGETENIASFAEGLKTVMLMEKITKDAARTIGQAGRSSRETTILKRSDERQSFWKKIVG